MERSTKRKAPGKAHRNGLSLFEVMEMFPNEDTAREWIESIIWPGERCCGKCGSARTREASHKTMPYWCTDCRGYFSVKTGTPLANSNIPLRKWAIGIYLCLTSLKSVSSMKLHRDLEISQKAAWFMLHRIREAWALNDDDGNKPRRLSYLQGPVEADEAYFGGHRRNMSHAKRKGLKGRGPADKTAVAGVKDRASNQIRAKIVEKTDAKTLQYFVGSNMNPFSKVYTDDASVYASLPLRHETVKHSVGEMSEVRPTPMESRASGPCSSTLTKERFIRSARST